MYAGYDDDQRSNEGELTRCEAPLDWTSTETKNIDLDTMNAVLRDQIILLDDSGDGAGFPESWPPLEANPNRGETWEDFVNRMGPRCREETFSEGRFDLRTSTVQAKFLLAVNIVLRNHVMGRAVCVALPGREAGVPGTRCTLRGLLRNLMRSSGVQSLSVHDIQMLFRDTFGKLFPAN